MCRFTLYMGPSITLASLVTEPEHSLIHQSHSSKERDEPLNGDGFGIAWWVPRLSPDPAVFRSVSPAWSNRNLLDLARVVESRCILAHVRAATQGILVSEANCHPFNVGRFAFMHNGDVGGFARVRRHLLSMLTDEAFGGIAGSTDSEHVFALWRDTIRTQGDDGTAGALARALGATVRTVVGLVEKHGGAEPSYLNLAVSDGKRAAVCRFTTDAPEHAQTLYLNRGKRYVCEEGVCHMVSPEEGKGAIIVASEPLSKEPGWEAVPLNHVASIEEGGAVDVRPIG